MVSIPPPLNYLIKLQSASNFLGKKEAATSENVQPTVMEQERQPEIS